MKLNRLKIYFSYLNTNENKKITQSIRTFCDYLIIECSNNTMDKIRNVIYFYLNMVYPHLYFDKFLILLKYVSVIIRMINHYNVFTYDRFLFIMVRILVTVMRYRLLVVNLGYFSFLKTFRSFDSNDTQIAFQILNLLFVQNMDFQTKLNDFFNVNLGFYLD